MHVLEKKLDARFSCHKTFFCACELCRLTESTYSLVGSKVVMQRTLTNWAQEKQFMNST